MTMGVDERCPSWAMSKPGWWREDDVFCHSLANVVDVAGSRE
ncbi:MAG TPA: hypothetical protein VFW59_05900 [Gallionella sp.]|nr:hypothetical protein [Gallionella sp.]